MGVTVETTKDGDQRTYPKPGDFVTMDYIGTLLDGTVRCDAIFSFEHFVEQISLVLLCWCKPTPPSLLVSALWVFSRSQD